MKILMIGLGSIGQRHLRNLKRLLGQECEILAYRTRRLQRTFSDDMKVREGVDLESEFSISTYTDLDDALNQKPDAVFVTNITSLHMEYAVKAARAGCHVFIEKPLSDSLDGVDELREAVERNRVKAFMGFQNRYHPCVMAIKECLNKELIGKVVHVESRFCERLATMHSYEDYRGTYMANASMGGGPVMNLLVHDLDCLQWLFGTPVSVYAVSGKASGLEIDVEDFSVAVYALRSRCGDVTASVITDFFQYPPVHTLTVVGDAGRIEADLNAASIKAYSDGTLILDETYGGFRRNDLFIAELRSFFKCIEDDSEPEIGLEQGVVSLKMALAQKESAARGKPVIIS